VGVVGSFDHKAKALKVDSATDDHIVGRDNLLVEARLGRTSRRRDIPHVGGLGL